MLIVISQLITAYLIEVFGIFGMERTGFSFRKVIGMGIAILGILIFKWE
jgi:transporter family-2 protein